MINVGSFRSSPSLYLGSGQMSRHAGTLPGPRSPSNVGSAPRQASVLDSSEISTESGRTSRFPKPELEIQFTPLQPNKLNLRRQGGDSVTVKITRTARKRKSAEMDKVSSGR